MNAGPLWRGGDPDPLVAPVEAGAVAIVEGRIAYVGADADLPRDLRRLRTLDAGGRAVLPGLVDCHTHLPFAAWRADEYAVRLQGASYADQQRRHGLSGIARSAAELAASAEPDVLAFCQRRLREAARAGTTTLEMKSGYGGDGEGELRSLGLMATLRGRTAVRLVRTALLLHARPADGDRRAWVEAAVSDILPRAVAAGLVDGVDAFVETIAYSLEEAAPLIRAGQAAGLATHLHAEQLAPSGAALWAASHGVTSVDHLDHLDPAGVRALCAGATVAVLLPGATFLSGGPRLPPVGDLLAGGAAVALATDLNPGTSPVASLPECVAIACRAWGMPLSAALAGVTVNAAAALGRAAEVGALRPGMAGDAVILDGDEPALLAYRLGHAAVWGVVSGGRVLVWGGEEDEPKAS